MTQQIQTGSDYNAKEFHLTETFSNESGKTSLSAVMGFILSVVGALAFTASMYACIFYGKDTALVNISCVMTGLGVTLLGVRKAFTPPVPCGYDPTAASMPDDI